MKKALVYILSAVLAVALAASIGGCAVPSGGSSKIQIVTTIFPLYDWVRSVAGDSENVEITLLLDNGVDLHSFQPKAADVVKISKCDMFVYVGGESDRWVTDVLGTAVNKDMTVINLLELLGSDAKAEELKEGMEAGHDGDEDDDHGHEAENDEHVWLSLRNAVRFCAAIKEALCRLDSANSSKYESNLKSYTEKLEQLDLDYCDAVTSANRSTLLFGDRFPFRYLVDDYALNYYAAFSGCSAESEASFETVVFLAKKIDEFELGAVIALEGSDGKIAETIKNTTAKKDQKILYMNSLQSVTAKDIAEGVTYLGEMEKNLQVLKEALG
ncbi:MAG: zinc ABC transporter substrate-binding protein [Clostridia bacterium]|nr:zinc ABC transporter substrate-binding protein [Clostridia bacterium]